MSATDTLAQVGVVAIGRNEGSRLERCLRSVVGRAEHVVYVDSGSTDGSVEMARALGAEVVELDLGVPFTAARARNAGLARLLEVAPQVEFVQFVDGDCEVVDGWLARALETCATHSEAAIVCGRRRERHPEASIYNRLCDLEWDTPIGESLYCGGDALMRVQPLRELGGYNPALIAGEEPELCVRLRAAGWKVLRIDAKMTLHDADMQRFSQWWKRAVRAGHAYAEGAWLHGRRTGHWVRATLGIVAWGGVVPLALLALAWPTSGLSLALLPCGYAALWTRSLISERRRGRSTRDAWAVATFTVPAKFAQAEGVVRYALRKLRRSTPRLIEYKHAVACEGSQ